MYNKPAAILYYNKMDIMDDLPVFVNITDMYQGYQGSRISMATKQLLPHTYTKQLTLYSL